MYKTIFLIALLLTYTMRVESVVNLTPGAFAQTDVGSLGLSIAYNIAGDKLITGSTEGVILYTNTADLTNAAEIQDLTYGDEAKIGAVKGVAFIDTEAKVAAVVNSTEETKSLRVWDATTYASFSVFDFGLEGPEEVIAETGTSVFVAVLEQKVYKLEETAGTYAKTLTLGCSNCGSDEIFNCMAYRTTAPAMLAVGTSGDKVLIYTNFGADGNEGSQAAVLSAPESIIFFSVGGNEYLAAGSDYKVTIFDTTDFTAAVKIHSLDYTLYNFHSFGLGNNDTLFAGCLEKIIVFDLTDFEATPQQIDSIHGHYVYAMTFSNDKSKLATISTDKTFKLYDVNYA